MCPYFMLFYVFSEGNARSLLLQKGHLKVANKRKSTYEKLVSA